jgi:hypothetical protein
VSGGGQARIILHFAFASELPIAKPVGAAAWVHPPARPLPCKMHCLVQGVGPKLLSEAHGSGAEQNTVMKPLLNVVLFCSVFANAQQQPVKRPPPLPITILKTGADTAPQAPDFNELTASGRFSDEFIEAGKKTGNTGLEKVRFALICIDNHPECIPLRPGKTYWMSPVYPWDVGYAYEFLKDKCDPWSTRGVINGEERLVVYALCPLGDKKAAKNHAGSQKP